MSDQRQASTLKFATMDTDTVVHVLVEYVLEYACEDSPLSRRSWLPILALASRRFAEVLRTPAYIKQWNLRYSCDRPWFIPRVEVDLRPSTGVLFPGKKDQPVDLVNDAGGYVIMSARLSWCGRFVKVLYQDQDAERSAEFLHGFKSVRPGLENTRYASLALFWDVDDLRRYAAEAMGVDVARDALLELSDLFRPMDSDDRETMMCRRMKEVVRHRFTYLSLGGDDKGRLAQNVVECLSYASDQIESYWGSMSRYWNGQNGHSSFTVITYNSISDIRVVYQREYRGEVFCNEPFLCDREGNAFYVVSGDGCRLDCHAPWNVPTDRLLKNVLKGPDFNCRAISVYLEKGFDLQRAQEAMPCGEDFRTARFHPGSISAAQWLMKRTQDVVPEEDRDNVGVMEMARLRAIVVESGMFDTREDVRAAFLASENMYVMGMLLEARRDILLPSCSTVKEEEEYKGGIAEEDVGFLASLAMHVLRVWDGQVHVMELVPIQVVVAVLSLAGGVENKRRVVARIEELSDSVLLCRFHAMPPRALLREELLPIVDLRATFAHRAFKDLPFLTTWVGNAVNTLRTAEDQEAMEEEVKAEIVEFARLGYPINIMGRKYVETLFGVFMTSLEMDMAIWMLEEFGYERLEPRIGMDMSDWRFEFGERGKEFQRALAEFMNDGGREPWIDIVHFLMSKPRPEMFVDTSE